MHIPARITIGWSLLRAGFITTNFQESTTERKLSALLLALKAVQGIFTDIKNEKVRLREMINGGKPVQRNQFRLLTSPEHQKALLIHWISLATNIIASLDEGEIIPANIIAVAMECVQTLDALADDQCIASVRQSFADLAAAFKAAA